MSIKEIRDVLLKHKKNVVDVASATKLNPTTVRRFICGLSHNRTTEFLIVNYCNFLEDENDNENTSHKGSSKRSFFK